MSPIQPEILAGIQIIESSCNSREGAAMNDALSRSHQPQFLCSRATLHPRPRFPSEMHSSSRASRLTQQERTTDEESLASGGAHSIWDSVHIQASSSNLWPQQTLLRRACSPDDYKRPEEEFFDALSDELEARIQRDIEQVLGDNDFAHPESATTAAPDTARIEIFHYGSDPAEQESRARREEHARECAYVDVLIPLLTIRYEGLLEILGSLTENLREMEAEIRRAVGFEEAETILD